MIYNIYIVLKIPLLFAKKTIIQHTDTGESRTTNCKTNLLSQQLWQDTALFCRRKKMSFCGCNSSKPGHNPKSGSENSASSFNLFIPCVCAGRACSVYWSKQDFISVLSVEETSAFDSRLSLFLPFLLFYFCLVTEPVAFPGMVLCFLI